MMFSCLLIASLVLLATTQKPDEDGFCEDVCQVGQWKEWGPCSSTCGGQRTRKRKICCSQTEDLHSCLDKCHQTLADHVETQPCLCIFGTVDAFGRCICEDHSSGDCCQYNNLKCSDSPCTSNATCINRGLHGTECQCPAQWFGRNCDVFAPTARPYPNREIVPVTEEYVFAAAIGICTALVVAVAIYGIKCRRKVNTSVAPNQAPVIRHTRRGEVNPTGHKPSSTPATEEDEDTSVQSGDIYSDARQLVIITKE